MIQIHHQSCLKQKWTTLPPPSVSLWYYCWRHCLLAACNSLQRKKTTITISVWSRNPDLSATKSQSKTAVCIKSRQVFFLTAVVRGNSCLWGKEPTRSALRPLLFYLGFYQSPSSPSFPPSVGLFFYCTAEFPQLFQLFSITWAWWPWKTCLFLFWLRSGKRTLLCAVIRPQFFREGRLNIITKARLIGNQSIRGWCHFLQSENVNGTSFQVIRV